MNAREEFKNTVASKFENLNFTVIKEALDDRMLFIPPTKDENAEMLYVKGDNTFVYGKGSLYVSGQFSNETGKINKESIQNTTVKADDLRGVKPMLEKEFGLRYNALKNPAPAKVAASPEVVKPKGPAL